MRPLTPELFDFGLDLGWIMMDADSWYVGGEERWGSMGRQSGATLGMSAGDGSPSPQERSSSTGSLTIAQLDLLVVDPRQLRIESCPEATHDLLELL